MVIYSSFIHYTLKYTKKQPCQNAKIRFKSVGSFVKNRHIVRKIDIAAAEHRRFGNSRYIYNFFGCAYERYVV